MLEREIEKFLVEEIQKLGGIAYKFTSPARRSVPDRLCVMPNGEVIFIEVKKETGKLTKGQVREHERLRNLLQQVETVYSKDDISYILNEWKDLQ
jgi:hypothetical protein